MHKYDITVSTTVSHHPLQSLQLCLGSPCTRNNPLESFAHTLRQGLTEFNSIKCQLAKIKRFKPQFPFCIGKV